MSDSQRFRRRGMRGMRVGDRIIVMTTGWFLYALSPEFRELVHRQVKADEAENAAIKEGHHGG